MQTDFAAYWGSIRGRTMRVAELVPDDRFEWSPGSGVMTFGDLLRHLAMTERWMFVETAMGRPSLYRSHGREIADGKAATLDLMRRQHADSVALLGAMTPEALQQKILTPANAPMTAWKWLRAMVEHEVHHRGQIYVMLRLCGVPTPPIFGLTSEEVRGRAPDPGEERR